MSHFFKRVAGKARDPRQPFNPPEPYASMYRDIDLPPRLLRDGELETFPSLWRQILARPDFYERYTQEDWNTVRCLAYGMVTLIDDAIGRVLEALEKQGLLESTLNVIRTPLIWKEPASNGTGGRKIPVLTQSMDIMPSILEVCDVPIPTCVQGKSMLPLLHGDAQEGLPRVLTENYLSQKVGANWDNWICQESNTLVTPDWKYTLRSDGDIGQLFDRRNDPEELRNLWNDPAFERVRAKLAEELALAISASREHPWRQETMW